MSGKVPGQDSGEALVGRKCFVWDHLVPKHEHPRIVKITGYDPFRCRGEYLYESNRVWWCHARPVELGHPDPNHPSHKETKMTDLETARKNFNDAKAAFEEMGRSLKAMEENEVAKRPKLAKGQVWRNIRAGNLYMVSTLSGTDFRLVRINGADCDFGGVYRENGFDGNNLAFEYIGMAKDILAINLPK